MADDRRKLDALRDKIADVVADPRPSVSAEEVFDRTEKLLRELKARKKG